MDRHICKHKTDNSITSGHGSTQESGSGINAAARAFRATTAIVVFGLPLVAGVATFLGYGVYKAYKRIVSRS
jgi:hypothetical protein